MELKELDKETLDKETKSLVLERLLNGNINIVFKNKDGKLI